MKLLLVSNDKVFREAYQKMISNFVEVSQSFDCATIEEALCLIVEHDIDVVIAETNTESRSIFSLAAMLFKLKISVAILVIAPDDSLAIEAIKHHISKYFVKPFQLPPLCEAIKESYAEVRKLKMVRDIEKNSNAKLRVSTHNGFVIIDIDKVVYCEADGAYTRILTDNGKEVLSSMSLGKVEEKLKTCFFVRVNRSVLVNMQKVKRIEKFKKEVVVEIGNKEHSIFSSKYYMQQLDTNNLNSIKQLNND